jgi:uncharacterized membrane protein
MNEHLKSPRPSSSPRAHHPFRRAVLRGLGVVLPPLLTIIVFLWAWNLISGYVLEPVEGGVRRVLVWAVWDVRTQAPGAEEAGQYVQLSNGRWIPTKVYEEVNANPGHDPPATPPAYFDRYVRIHYLRPTTVIPLFLAVFILTLYLLGKFLAAGIGRWTWAAFEALIHRLPLIRNVYSSVKQVTDFVFSEQEIEFNRVVAVEYPRKGIWSIGFVTGESMLDIRSAANEPVLSVLMPTSPMPATGFTVTVRKSETIDLDITIDQAIQFVVSCGVVVPSQQRYKDEVSSRISAALAMPSNPKLAHERRGTTDASSNGEGERGLEGDGKRQEVEKAEQG